jgi:hypothetical protein
VLLLSDNNEDDNDDDDDDDDDEVVVGVTGELNAEHDAAGNKRNGSQ